MHKEHWIMLQYMNQIFREAKNDHRYHSKKNVSK